jgi:hypothetical protein
MFDWDIYESVYETNNKAINVRYWEIRDSEGIYDVSMEITIQSDGFSC